MYSSARAIRAASPRPAPAGAGSNGWSARDKKGTPGPSPSAAPKARSSTMAPVLLGPSRPAILPASGVTSPPEPPRPASLPLVPIRAVAFRALRRRRGALALEEPEVSRDGRDRIAASVAVRRDADRGPEPPDARPQRAAARGRADGGGPQAEERRRAAAAEGLRARRPGRGPGGGAVARARGALSRSTTTCTRRSSLAEAPAGAPRRLPGQGSSPPTVRRPVALLRAPAARRGASPRGWLEGSRPLG